MCHHPSNAPLDGDLSFDHARRPGPTRLATYLRWGLVVSSLAWVSCASDLPQEALTTVGPEATTDADISPMPTDSSPSQSPPEILEPTGGPSPTATMVSMTPQRTPGPSPTAGAQTPGRTSPTPAVGGTTSPEPSPGSFPLPTRTPANAPTDTPFSLTTSTPYSTPHSTPYSTPVSTPYSTPAITPASTPVSTPANTPSVCDTVWYLDFDQDGFGDNSTAVIGCQSPDSVHTTLGGDCNDLYWSINPEAHEFCNGQDNDCDGVPDDGCSMTCDVPPCKGGQGPMASLDLVEYKGELSYLFHYTCSNCPVELYTIACDYICQPWGGFTGEGDGACPTFFQDGTFLETACEY